MRKKSYGSTAPFVGACVIAAGVAGAWLSASSPSGPSHSGPQHPVPMTVRGFVSGTYFTPPAGTAPSSTAASHYEDAKVCADVNDNAVCDGGEPVTFTDKHGRFELHSPVSGPIVAEILTTTINSAGDTDHENKGRKGKHDNDDKNDKNDKDDRHDGNDKDHQGGKGDGDVVTVFRASFDQIVEGASHSGRGDHGDHGDGPVSADVVITPLSTEVVRMMEADHVEYWKAKANLATRLNVPAGQLLRDLDEAGADRTALLTESNILSNRFTLAAKMVRRHDVSPAALANNPHATHPALTMKEAQQVVMNLEGIPRYDHIFVIMLENKATSSIKNSPFAHELLRQRQPERAEPHGGRGR